MAPPLMSILIPYMQFTSVQDGGRSAHCPSLCGTEALAVSPMSNVELYGADPLHPHLTEQSEVLPLSRPAREDDHQALPT